MIVIADDITGAAEIAGIAFAHGEDVRLVCGDVIATNGISVVATDTRSMSEADAVAETRRIASRLLPHDSFLFKKTDSALRGHVVAELSALMQTTGYRRAVYVPANPSKGRVISNGIYYVHHVPIADTDFSFDPEFPAYTSTLEERFPDASAKGILMPDVENLDDIRRIIFQYNDGYTLFAGAADLFANLLETGFSEESVSLRKPSTSVPSIDTGLSTLILCGSTQSKAIDCGIAASGMPEEVYNGSDDISSWDFSTYETTHSLILTIPFSHRTGHEAAHHLRTMMALMAKRLVTLHCPAHLIIEGGATAWATLQALGWTQFDIVAQHAPGIVTMRTPAKTLVTIKPGSYPWGKIIE